MKKTGYFFLGFVPIILAVIAQFAAMFFMIFMAAIFLAVRMGGDSRSLSAMLYTLMSDNEFSACFMVIYCLICICVLGIWYYRSLGGDFLPNVRTTFHPLQFVGIVLLVPGIQFATSYLIGIVSMMFPSWLESYLELMESSGLGGDYGTMMLVYAVFIGPIAEELIFRGVTLRCFRRAVPFWIANLCQATLFGIYHMNLLQGIYAGALGLVLGYVCERGGSIYLSMFLHLLYNFWGTIVTSAISGLGIDETVLALLMLLTMVVSLSVGGVVFHLGQKKKNLTVRRFQIQENLQSS
jgi:membrane protease YdiL (CAAX protease family)